MTSIAFERIDVPHDGEGGPTIRMSLKPNMRPFVGDAIRLKGLQGNPEDFAFYEVVRCILWPERGEIVCHVRIIGS